MINLKVYKILVIDDLPDIIIYFKDIKEIFEERNLGIHLEFEYEHHVDKLDISKPYDIVMFDFNFSGGRVVSKERNKTGLHLIKNYRLKNKQTKIIFYSSSFNINSADQITLKHKDYFEMINELNIFKLIYKNDSESTLLAIEEAIRELDIIMTSLEKMSDDYSELNLTFDSQSSELSLEELIYEIKMDTNEGREFRKNIVELITNYMAKFEDN